MCARHPSPLSTRTNLSDEEEQRLRRERFWMLIRVLMKYIEQKDHELYLRAKETIQDCVKRNRMREKGFRSLSTCVQKSVKDVVGNAYWRRAETYLTRTLVKKANEEADEAMRLQFHMEQVRCHPYQLAVANGTKNNVLIPGMYAVGANASIPNIRQDYGTIPSKRPCTVTVEPATSNSLREDSGTVTTSNILVQSTSAGKRRRF